MRGNNFSCRTSGEGPAPLAGQGGFTLLELLTVMAVAAISMVIAIPAINNVLNADRLTATTNTLIGSIQQAQLEAIKLNSLAQFCSNSSTNNGTDTLGTACGSGSPGAVYSYSASNLLTPIQGAVQIPPSVSIGDGTSGTTAVTALRFSGSGIATTATATGTTPYTGFVADIYTTQLSSNNHRCIYITTGSNISSCVYSSACPAPNAPTSCQTFQ